jgi:hypothetical protein
MIQGNFLKKKDGFLNELVWIELRWSCICKQMVTLLGPILEEFKQKKFQLIQSSHELMIKALAQRTLCTRKTTRSKNNFSRRRELQRSTIFAQQL